MRNVLARVPKGTSEMVAAAIRTVLASPTASTSAASSYITASMLGRQFPDAETMLRDAREDLLTLADFPPAHWRKIWSTNPLELAGGFVAVC